ncbi:Phosphotransferase enzyme [Aspergillus tanneri]|uniref:Phosphotransferase enzyme n=1 Tax=Aspergillus tanneri TaxID=1220188 RepID=A0A5M9MQF8_9EURO|nr:Phosphotransferase enzyme [Aspergillus tanneri]KAA8649295.1 Phosphotransferase enzyme [Aspergillus tanneri]
MANIVGNPHELFGYTSGRWIWDEKEQLRERYHEFDILELQKIAMESASSESCVKCKDDSQKYISLLLFMPA